jgi:hypothetical protein
MAPNRDLAYARPDEVRLTPDHEDFREPQLSRHLTLVWPLRDMGPRQTELAVAWGAEQSGPGAIIGAYRPSPGAGRARLGPISLQPLRTGKSRRRSPGRQRDLRLCRSKAAWQAAHLPRLVPWRISYSPLIHQIICHTKPLKSHKENVRPQSLSLRQSAQSGHSFSAAEPRPKPHRMRRFAV